MVISVDTGNKQIKTVNKIFSAGLVVSESYPPFGRDVLFYNNKYYTVSTDRIPYMRNKTLDNRYFVLTLFAIAYELNVADVDFNEQQEIQLLIGLPPAHYGTMRNAYEHYFLKNGMDVEFEFNGKPIGVNIGEVHTYPQAFAAIAPIIGEVRQYPKSIIIDIGGYTADLLLLKHDVPDLSICESLEYGTIKFYNMVRRKVNADYDTLIHETDIDDVLTGRDTPLEESIVLLITEAASQYIRDFFHQLRELEIDLKTYHTLFVGGGSILFKPFIDQIESFGKKTFIDQISANAKGYEILYMAGGR